MGGAGRPQLQATRCWTQSCLAGSLPSCMRCQQQPAASSQQGKQQCAGLATPTAESDILRGQALEVPAPLVTAKVLAAHSLQEARQAGKQASKQRLRMTRVRTAVRGDSMAEQGSMAHQCPLAAAASSPPPECPAALCRRRALQAVEHATPSEGPVGNAGGWGAGSSSPASPASHPIYLPARRAGRVREVPGRERSMRPTTSPSTSTEA